MTAEPAGDPATGPWIPEWTLGDRLRKIRRHVGVSQAAFAEQLQLNPKNYSTWEADQAKPRQLVPVAQRIEALTGVPAAWVLGLDATLPFRSAAPQTRPGSDPVIR